MLQTGHEILALMLLMLQCSCKQCAGICLCR